MNNNKILTYKKTALLLCVFFLLWTILDRSTKILFDSGQFHLGQNISDSILGIFHLTLVHNTGAAFGMFANATYILAALSFIIAVFLIAMPFVHLKRLNNKKTNYQLMTAHLFCVGIIAAGGIGNAIDRVVNGYVVDFICFDFIDFPVFNIADIGITCGIVLLIIIMLYNVKKTDKN